MARMLKLAFILDPLESLKPYKDSSVAMMRAAAARGHAVWAIQREALVWRDEIAREWMESFYAAFRGRDASDAAAAAARAMREKTGHFADWGAFLLVRGGGR